MSLAKFRQRAQQGFTLVELLIVVIILAILAAIVVPQFGSSTDDAKLSALDANLAGLRSAIAVYKQQHENFPGGTTAVPAADCTAAVKGTGDASDDAKKAIAFKDQLTLYTNAAGQACGAKSDVYKYGPYLKEIPKDPIKNLDTVAVQTTGLLTLTASAATGGWLFDTVSGRIVTNNNSPIAAGSAVLLYSR